jgi:hypothetical protein
MSPGAKIQKNDVCLRGSTHKSGTSVVNSTPPISPISWQNSFLDCFRNEKRGPPQCNCLDRFLQAHSPQILTPKEHVFDMPISTNYGSTGRPPGEYHLRRALRHSLKEFMDNLESPYPPFDIFSINTTNNSKNNIYCSNGGTQTTINSFHVMAVIERPHFGVFF